MRKPKDRDSEEMRAHYDFSGAVRGKYAGRIRSGGRVVVLDADVAKLFPDSRSVNHALRTLTEVFKDARRKTRK